MTEKSRGVMDRTYATARTRRAELDFRLRGRAWAAVEASRRFAGRPVRTILDLGSADGRTMALVHGWLDAERSVGVEASEELIAAAPPLPEGCSLVLGDLAGEVPELAGRTFDLVTALALLEHLKEPAKVLDLARRHLAPGGLFVATAPVPFWDSASGALGLHREEHHEWKVEPRRLRHLGHDAGLDWVIDHRFMFVPVAALPYLRIPVGHRFASTVDRLVRRLRVLDVLFVNQLFVLRRPGQPRPSSEG